MGNQLNTAYCMAWGSHPSHELDDKFARRSIILNRQKEELENFSNNSEYNTLALELSCTWADEESLSQLNGAFVSEVWGIYQAKYVKSVERMDDEESKSFKMLVVVSKFDYEDFVQLDVLQDLISQMSEAPGINQISTQTVMYNTKQEAKKVQESLRLTRNLAGSGMTSDDKAREIRCKWMNKSALAECDKWLESMTKSSLCKNRKVLIIISTELREFRVVIAVAKNRWDSWSGKYLLEGPCSEVVFETANQCVELEQVNLLRKSPGVTDVKVRTYPKFQTWDELLGVDE